MMHRFSKLTWMVAGAALLAIPVAAGAQTAAPPAPTFTKDVAPIFQAKCESCHRLDSVAPMSLITYEEVRPWAARSAIASRRATCRPGTSTRRSASSTTRTTGR